MKLPNPKEIVTNKHMSSLFFAFFLTFFFIFVANKYTMNIIMSVIMLQFSLAFKTWQLIRDMEDRFNG
jgi:hypothetical protein